MNFSEAIKLAFDQILAHKLRSFLTLLGMIIGVTAFMIVLSLLQGFSSYVDEKLAGIGSNSFTVRRFSFDDFKDTDTIAAAQRRNTELTFDEMEFIKERAQLVGLIGAKAGGMSRDVKGGGETLASVQISGAEPVTALIDKLDIADGRFFSEPENANGARVAYVGWDVANKLYPRESAIGQELTIQGIPYRIIGVQTAKGTVFGQPQDNFITLPIKTFGSAFGGLTRQRAPYFVVTSKDEKNVADTVEEVRMLMRIKRKIPFGEKDSFGILTPDAITNLIGGVTKPIGTVILAVPSIALLVGGIVIMNIMLVAVTERTREIGIRKSLGARQSDILRQFLLESATLSALGGIIGLIIAEIAGVAITAFFFPTKISLLAAFFAIAFSGVVGGLAGLYPAWKAARLDPIEALRAD
ncbi:MAG: ABC transporter permease [Chloracidobacterium sp.]|nr:ABC transporter permease [Chloracidobacterium sp.]MBP9935978.1 ABC transporter permease [Pyrinomonadaceae bacterium]